MKDTFDLVILTFILYCAYMVGAGDGQGAMAERICGPEYTIENNLPICAMDDL